MTALFTTEILFMLTFKPWLQERDQHELYHPHYQEKGSELNIVDGKFFPAIIVKD